jgi:hypothetical protein
MQLLGPLFSGQTFPVEYISQTISEFKLSHEKELKSSFERWIGLGILSANEPLAKRLQNFINAHYVYFFDDQFLEGEFPELYALMNEIWPVVNELLFLKFKNILELQLSIPFETIGISNTTSQDQV